MTLVGQAIISEVGEDGRFLFDFVFWGLAWCPDLIFVPGTYVALFFGILGEGRARSNFNRTWTCPLQPSRPTSRPAQFRPYPLVHPFFFAPICHASECNNSRVATALDNEFHECTRLPTYVAQSSISDQEASHALPAPVATASSSLRTKGT